MKELNDVRKAILNFAGWEKINEYQWENHEKRLILQILNVTKISQNKEDRRYRCVNLSGRADRFAPWQTLDERKCNKNCKEVLHKWLFEIL